MKKLLLLLVISGIIFPLLSARDSTRIKKTYTASEVSVPPEIDGYLNDEVWDAVPWDGKFMMYEPYDDRTPTQETQFKVLFDQENIYIGIRAFDTAPDSIVRRLTRRDDIDGDMVAFQFDSYHDLQTSFTFFVSAAGSKMDAYESENGDNTDETWNPVWWVKTQIDDRGWTAEAKIPFTQLRFDRHSDGIWGFQVGREIFRNNETSLWQPMSKEDPGWMHLMGELHGLEGIQPKKQAEIVPYVVAGNNWYEKEEGNPFREDGQNLLYNGGLDAKVGITNNFTLDLTVNPDFGQVEADPSQVNLTAFETYFEEQRPFFIEGKNIFDYDLAVHNFGNLFYSRRIGRRPQHYPDLEEDEYADIPEFTKILGAAKITGKTPGGLSVGIMESVTAAEKAEIDLDGEPRLVTVEPMSNYLAGRLVKEFNKGNTILGAMLTSTHRFNDEDHLDNLHSSAYSGGLDFEQYFADRGYSLSLSAYASQVKGSTEALIRTQRSPVHYFQRSDADYLKLDSSRTTLAGYGGSVSFGKQSGRFRFRTFLSMNNPGLELNDLGFLTSTDEIVQINWMQYRFNDPFWIIRRANINFNMWDFWDFGGTLQGIGTNINGYAQFNNLWHTGFYIGIDSPTIQNSALRGGPSMKFPGEHSMSLFVSTSSTKKLEVEIDGSYDKYWEESGYAYEAEIGLTYKPISNLNLSLYPEFSKETRELQYVDQQEIGADNRYIFGRIDQQTLSMSLRVDLILTPELTIQFWGQPFIASGDYSEFKYITNPRADAFRDRFQVYEDAEITYDPDDEIYDITENGGLNYTFENPDFNIKEFLSNLVFRWEYRPGSFIYLVWSQSRSGFDPYGAFRLKNDFSNIWDEHPSDVLLLKVSFRIGR